MITRHETEQLAINIGLALVSVQAAAWRNERHTNDALTAHLLADAEHLLTLSRAPLARCLQQFDAERTNP